MPYILPSPANSPPMKDGSLPSPTSSISYRLDSSDSLPTLSSQASSRSNSEDEQLSSPPTPDTGTLSIQLSNPMKHLRNKQQQQALHRPLRNHMRSHSHDAISGLSQSARRPSSDSPLRLPQQALSPPTGLIYLHPASPLDQADKADYMLAQPIASSSSSPKSTPSLFHFGSPPSTTEWPEGEPTDDVSLESPSPRTTTLPWSPPVDMPSRTFHFAPASTSQDSSIAASPTAESSTASTPKESSVLAAAVARGSHLRLDMNKVKEGKPIRPSPLPTPMVRKKSGELVRGALKHAVSHHDGTTTPEENRTLTAVGTRTARAKSAPATPTGPKNVHFDKQLEHVKLFLAQQRPTAVSRQGSPGETTEEESEAYPFPDMTVSETVSLILPNFPRSISTLSEGKHVMLQSLDIQQDTKVLRGHILVRNLAFHKRVVARFTLDDWQTISETTAEHVQALENGAIDQFVFRVKLQDMLARIADKRMLMVIKYVVNDLELWDNNDNRNYLIQFKQEAVPKPVSATERKANKYQWAVTNAGQASERMADLRKVLDRLVQEDTVEIPRANSTSRAFSNRYDFGASLKQHPGRTASDTNLAMHAQSNPYFHPIGSNTLIGGMPATINVTPQPRYARQEVDGVFHTDYGMPSYAFSNGQRMLPPVNAPPSPPHDADPPFGSEKQLPTTRSERFNSFPPASANSQSKTPVATHPPTSLTPRLFDEPWQSHSRFPAGRSISPAVSPRSTSPVPQDRPFANGKRPRSPPPRRATPDPSPPSSSDASYSSPLMSPSYMSSSSLPSLASDDDETPSYSGFLEKYCFFQPSKATGSSALGLVESNGESYFPPVQNGLATPRACGPTYLNSSSTSSSESTTPSGAGSPMRLSRPFEEVSKLVI